MRANPMAEGVTEILMPGEPESRTEARRLTDGIPYRRADLAPLVERARSRGVPLPSGV
jgi:LDH2 family malate/lactate/ureidoglycolate dehydrogenase